MDYIKIYDQLINRARSRNLNGYKERHHILPRCLGGSDEASNLVDLTAREHFIAHLLLVKVYPTKTSLIYAVKMMCRQSTPERSHNRMYEWLRIKEAQASSKMNRGSGNAFFGKTHTAEARRKISEAAKNSRPIRLTKVEKADRSADEISASARKGVETRRLNGTLVRSQASKDKCSRTKAAQPIEMKQSGRKNLGKKRTQDQKNKMSQQRKGRPAHNKGVPHTPEHVENIRLSNQSLPYTGDEICKFGCGQTALWERKSGLGALLCAPSANACPAVKARKVSKLVDRSGDPAMDS